MKRFKSIITIMLSLIVAVGININFMARTAYAEENITDPQAYIESLNLFLPRNKFELSAREHLTVYAYNSVEAGKANPAHIKYEQNPNDGKLYLMHSYDENLQKKDGDIYSDNIMDGRDASRAATIIATPRNIDRGNIHETREEVYKKWMLAMNDVYGTIIDGKKAEGKTITKNDIIIDQEAAFLPATVVDPDNGETVVINDKLLEARISTKDGLSQEDFETLNKIDAINKKAMKYDREGATLLRNFAYVSDGTRYRMVIATDNNWYLIEDASIPDLPEDPKPQEPEQKDPKKDFDTELSYSSVVEGKLEDETYYVPYYDNDNNKKDLDVTAIIKSKTDEGIKSTNGVDLKEDGTPNSEGWYYVNPEDKKVIARVYPFDEYDNTTYNGKVPKEEVKLVGLDGGKDEQTPAIEWTFRRKIIEETVEKDDKTNEEKSVTWVITYNLPVDEKSIPNDWSPIYDADGKTIHKITKTVKKGEDYDKDVTVKQNGTDKTVTTHVAKKWPKPTKIPQAGETLLVVIAVAVVALFAVSRYYKMSNNKK